MKCQIATLLQTQDEHLLQIRRIGEDREFYKQKCEDLEAKLSESRTTSGAGDTNTTTSSTFNNSRTESQVEPNGAIPPENDGALPEEISVVARSPQPNEDSVGPLDGTRTAKNRRFASLKNILQNKSIADDSQRTMESISLCDRPPPLNSSCQDNNPNGIRRSFLQNMLRPWSSNRDIDADNDDDKDDTQHESQMEYSYVPSLQYGDNDNSSHTCNGSTINDKEQDESHYSGNGQHDDDENWGEKQIQQRRNSMAASQESKQGTGDINATAWSGVKNLGQMLLRQKTDEVMVKAGVSASTGQGGEALRFVRILKKI